MTFKIMMIYPNGLLMIKKNIISKNHQSLKNSSNKRKKDLWPSMQEYLKRYYKLRLEGS